MLAVGLLLALGAQAQDHPANTAGAIVLKAAHLFDGRSGALTSPGIVVVKDQRIVAVGKDAAIPADASVVDLGDATLVPGYIDAHTHITFDHDDNWEKAFYENTLRSVPEQAFHAEANARRALRAGVTTARDVGSSDFIDVALRNAINDGLAEGPRLLVAGHAIGSTGGHCDSAPVPPDRMKPAGTLEGVCNGPSRAASRYASR